MSNAILTSIALTASFGLTLGATNASAAGPFKSSGSAVFAAEESTHRERATSALDNMLSRFINVDVEENTSATGSAAADVDNGECPEEQKETQIADSEETEEGEKKTPQGPEPIYFAF